MNCKGRKNMKSILICIVLSYVLLPGAGALKNPSFESPWNGKAESTFRQNARKNALRTAGQVFCSPETRQVK